MKCNEEDAGHRLISPNSTSHLAGLKAQNDTLLNWLFEEALPLWADAGVDTLQGGFFEKLGQDATPIEEPRRTRLVARQVFVFGAAGELGWQSPDTADGLVDHGLEFLTERCVTELGTVYSAISPSGQPIKPGFDLYDHAFALFALGSTVKLDYNRERLVKIGRRIRDAMVAGWKHPLSGFEESTPPSEPLRANPHMHLLEAFLEWEDADPSGGWEHLSDEIAALALHRFQDPNSGAIRERFHHTWRPATGRNGQIIEPGHQFEWAWLLYRWAKRRGRSDVFENAKKLTHVGERYGINEETGLAVNELSEDLSITDGASRLWPQTERIKAHIANAQMPQSGSDANIHIRLATAATASLKRYFATDIPGLWHETLDVHGEPVIAPARASSLYHIVCALRELDSYIGSIEI